MVELIFRHTVLQDCIQREITQIFAYSSFILTWLPMRVRSDPYYLVRVILFSSINIFVQRFNVKYLNLRFHQFGV
jgi:hypothetical protein